MAALLMVFLLVAGALLRSTEAQEDFTKLPDMQKKGVDLALLHLHSHKSIQHHFRFFRGQAKSHIDAGFDVNYLYYTFFLKATKCPKGTTDTDPQRCPFRNDRPLIDCAVCYKTYAGEIEPQPKPYVNCVQKTALTEEMKAERVKHCNTLGQTSGAATLLASKAS